MAQNFVVYRASAGSGKTFTLVKNYLKLALQFEDPNGFQRILAITFTIKAAGEMRERVLKTLAQLGLEETDKNFPNDMAKMLAEELKLPLATLRARAERTHQAILHRYANLGISTIDKFVLKVLKPFATFVQLEQDFDVTTDNQALLEEAIDRLLQQAGVDKTISNSLFRFQQYLLEDDKAINLREAISEAASLLDDDEADHYLFPLEKIKPEEFKILINEIRIGIKQFEKELAALGKEGLKIINESGAAHNLFSRSTIPKFLSALSEGKIEPLKDTVSKMITGESLFSKTSLKNEPALTASLDASVRVVLDKISTYFEPAQFSIYSLKKEVLKTIFLVELMLSLKKELNAVKLEKSVVPVSDFNKLVAEIIDDSPTPFIYERISERYRHFLIDEFQDTSVPQWQNFVPLLDESIANHYSMIVGDGKQAIYRFRKGDVEQFAKLPLIHEKNGKSNLALAEQNFERNYRGETLGTNYRSAKNIIDFNNKLYETLPKVLAPELQEIYKGAGQEKNSKREGYVSISILADEDYQEERNKAILENIQNAINRGYNLRDIAVLSHKAKAGAQVASFLLQNDIHVISPDSLFLGSNPELAACVALMELALDIEDYKALLTLVEQTISVKEGLKPAHEVMLEFQTGARRNPTWDTLGILAYLKVPMQALVKLRHANAFGALTQAIALLGFQDKPNSFLSFGLTVAQQNESDSDSIKDFVAWWNQKGYRKSIALPSDIDAVQIMTIHKSKGLEFPIVLFIDHYASNNSLKHYTWFDTAEQLSVPTSILRQTKSGLSGTPFEESFEKENKKRDLDKLNTVYVATTRASEELYIIRKQKSLKTEMAKHFYEAIKAAFGHDLAQNSKWELGTPSEKPKTDEKIKAVFSPIFTNAEKTPRIASKVGNGRVFDLWNPRIDNILGNEVHLAFGYIKSQATWKSDVESAFTAGEISETTFAYLNEKLPPLFENSQFAGWFDASIVAFNERNILDQKGQLHRPDRVLELEEKWVVLDYKTGTAHESHHAQVRSYVRAVGEIAPKPVEGFLIYLETQEIEKVMSQTGQQQLDFG